MNHSISWKKIPSWWDINMNLISKARYVYSGVIIIVLLSTLVSGLLVWNIAPEVGGSFWPYIRFGLSLIVGVVVGKIVAVISVYTASFYFINELFSFGNADDPWGDAEVESIMGDFREDE